MFESVMFQSIMGLIFLFYLVLYLYIYMKSEFF